MITVYTQSHLIRPTDGLRRAFVEPVHIFQFPVGVRRGVPGGETA